MKTWATELEGVLLIEPPTRFEDHRGTYIETWNRQLYEAVGVEIEWVVDNVSTSRRNVLRGIHGDYVTWKLVSCLYGSFYLIVIDNRPKSVQYLKWEAFTLSDRNNRQVLIPPGFGNGHYVLTKEAIFHYKQSRYYDRTRQFTLKWDDLALNLWWPGRCPILSRRDAGE